MHVLVDPDGDLGQVVVPRQPVVGAQLDVEAEALLDLQDVVAVGARRAVAGIGQ
ncbi:hypothetical protein [Actinomadura verrucosospora]|uniref:hypothetical protein n=1 Tax=Actinomadura verrucosospora TaxID=46165 RepID=UPI001FE9E973|nr:hypothetical protein [Actinomadura verrucosospora]